jgi:hypothetical protein
VPHHRVDRLVNDEPRFERCGRGRGAVALERLRHALRSFAQRCSSEGDTLDLLRNGTVHADYDVGHAGGGNADQADCGTAQRARQRSRFGAAQCGPSSRGMRMVL